MKAVDEPDAPHGLVRDWAEMHRRTLLCAIVALGVAILIYAKRQVEAYEASVTIYSPPWHSDSGVLVRVVGSVLVCWVLVGVASFCLCMRFTSSSRHLTICEAFYLCMQLLTTVGYGDFTPTTSNGMAFMSVYLVAGVCVVAALFGELLAWFIQQQQGKLKLGNIIKLGKLPSATSQLKKLKRAGSRVTKMGSWGSSAALGTPPSPASPGSGGPEADDGASGDEACERPTPRPTVSSTGSVDAEEEACEKEDCQECSVAADWGRIMTNFLPILALFAIGIAFFHLWPGEGKSLGEAIYMCCVTMTTVGFGAYHPVTQTGYAFTSVWMFLSVWFMARLIRTVVEVIFRRRRRATNAALAHGLLESLQSSGKQGVTKEEFLRLELIRCGLVRAKDIARVDRQFQALDSNADGLLDLADLDFWRVDGEEAARGPRGSGGKAPSVILESAEDEPCAIAGS